MKLLVLIPILMFLNLNSEPPAKQIVEFEGIIQYDVDIELKNKRLNKTELIDYYGKQKKYYYKNGNYKWATKKAFIEYEIYNHEVDSNCTVTKMPNNDSLYFRDFTTASDYISEIDSMSIKTICGIKCQGIKFTVNNDQHSEMIRTLYFPVDSLTYPKDYYSNQKEMANGEIYSYGGAIPLQLILDSEHIPFKIIYTASKIKAQSVNPSEFEISQTAPIVYR